MAKGIPTAVLVVVLTVLVGCTSIDTGQGLLKPARTTGPVGAAPTVATTKAGETDIVEQVATNRQAYQQALGQLVDYYTRTGNHMKLMWAKKELAALNSMPQYNYIVEASVAGSELRATTAIPEADYLFWEASEFERKASLLFIKDDNLLRLALDRYNQLIRKHPSSDKIDDAAYRAAGIYEHFKDYRVAALYYQRTYQWNPDTTYAVRFREAFILDKQLRERREALEAYRRALAAIKRKGEYHNWQKYAEKRVRELTKTEEEPK
jgi:tetratricopeptide (TPR) repeat protein